MYVLEFVLKSVFYLINNLINFLLYKQRLLSLKKIRDIVKKLPGCYLLKNNL